MGPAAFLLHACATILSMFRLRPKKSAVLNRKKKVKKQLSVLQKQGILGVLLAVLLGLIITGIWYGSRIDSMQITDVRVVGGETIPHSQIQQRAEAALEGAYLSLVPRRFIPFYPKEAIAQQVSTIERVRHVDVSREDQTIVVVFEEYVPYALWCAQAQDAGCLFIDHTGFAYTQAPELEGTAFIRYIDIDRAPERGITAFPKTFLSDTQLFSELLEDELDLYVTHVTKYKEEDTEYTLSGGGIIKTSQNVPAQVTFENLRTILTSEAFSHLAPGAFQYIDLRFGDKVFVNETVATPEGMATTSSSTSAEQGMSAEATDQ